MFCWPSGSLLVPCLGIGLLLNLVGLQALILLNSPFKFCAILYIAEQILRKNKFFAVQSILAASFPGCEFIGSKI